MPLYEYECGACGHRFERIQKFSDPPVDTCPQCGGAVHKLMSSPAVQFKGTGWYVTDYAGKGREKSEATGKAGGTGKAEATEKTGGTEVGAKDSAEKKPAAESAAKKTSE